MHGHTNIKFGKKSFRLTIECNFMLIRIFCPAHKKPEKNSSSPISRNKTELLLSFLFFVAEAMAKIPDNLSFEEVRPGVQFMSHKEDMSGEMGPPNPDVDCNEHSMYSARRRGCQP
jgi:hypothetical protein